jgi:hypothetical protein
VRRRKKKKKEDMKSGGKKRRGAAKETTIILAHIKDSEAVQYRGSLVTLQQQNAEDRTCLDRLDAAHTADSQISTQ